MDELISHLFNLSPRQVPELIGFQITRLIELNRLLHKKTIRIQNYYHKILITFYRAYSLSVYGDYLFNKFVHHVPFICV